MRRFVAAALVTIMICLGSCPTSTGAWSISSSAFVPRHHGLRTGYTCSSQSSILCMKIFDWKRRNADESLLNNVEETEWTFNNLKSAPGSRKRPQRKGRGISAGQGASCGFGMRGQKSRKGRPTRPGFEGGQTPLYRRLPKFVGRPTGPGHEKTIYNLLHLDSMNPAPAGSVCNFDVMLENKWATKSKYDLHKVVMGRNEFVASDLVVQAHAFTRAAREAIEARGGKCQLLSRTTHKVLEEVAAE